MRNPQNQVVSAARKACKSFAAFSPRFFDFESREAWLGWENWLTVEIARLLDNKLVRAFGQYPTGKQRFDLYINGPTQVAVEIKVNYITNGEAERPNRPMPDRIVRDAKKLKKLKGSVSKLLLVATCFQSRKGLKAYRRAVQHDLEMRFGEFSYKWFNCSSHDGHNLLLALWC